MVLPFLRIGLRENAEKELKAIEEKGLNTNNVDNAYKLVEIVKGIDKINMMPYKTARQITQSTDAPFFSHRTAPIHRLRISLSVSHHVPYSKKIYFQPS